MDPHITSLLVSSAKATPVDCSLRHNTLTYAVGTLDQVKRRPHGMPDEWPRRVQELVREICDPGAAEMQIAGQRWSRLRPAIYLPTPVEWEQGEHWVRCDVKVEKLFTAYSADGPEAFDNLPATLDELRSSPKAAFTTCRKAAEDSEQQVLVSCDREGVWRPRGAAVRIPTAKSGSYPGVDAIVDFGKERCRVSGKEAYGFTFPEEQEWVLGMHWMVCNVID